MSRLTWGMPSHTTDRSQNLLSTLKQGPEHLALANDPRRGPTYGTAQLAIGAGANSKHLGQ